MKTDGFPEVRLKQGEIEYERFAQEPPAACRTDGAVHAGNLRRNAAGKQRAANRFCGQLRAVRRSGMVNAMDLQLLKSYVLGNITSFPAGDASFGGCGGENSLMMAGSASKITDFDGWMLRYVWSKIKDESGRFS